MKKNGIKIMNIMISATLIGGSCVYAFAAQYNQPQTVLGDTSSVVSSEAVSSAVSSTIESVAPVESVQSIAESVVVSSSAPKEEVSSVESTVTSVPAEMQIPVSQPEQTPNPVSGSSASSSNICYYDVFSPSTGGYIGVQDPNYFYVQTHLGGDAGKVPPDQSVACQNALKQWKAKQASSTASTK